MGILHVWTLPMKHQLRTSRAATSWNLPASRWLKHDPWPKMPSQVGCSMGLYTEGESSSIKRWVW
jgi:hypothetical protein